jgi:hypothetical protein
MCATTGVKTRRASASTRVGLAHSESIPRRSARVAASALQRVVAARLQSACHANSGCTWTTSNSPPGVVLSAREHGPRHAAATARGAPSCRASPRPPRDRLPPGRTAVGDRAAASADSKATPAPLGPTKSTTRSVTHVLVEWSAPGALRSRRQRQPIAEVSKPCGLRSSRLTTAPASQRARQRLRRSRPLGTTRSSVGPADPRYSLRVRVSRKFARHPRVVTGVAALTGCP